MSALQGLRGQIYPDRMYDASGTITSGGTAQLLLPKSEMRSSLLIQNTSDTNMFIEIGSARASATLTTGTVTSVSVTNAGFGYWLAPTVKFVGGAYTGFPTNGLTVTLPSDASWPSPARPAKAHCNMTGAAGSMTISSITIDDPGAGYQYPPYIVITNNPLDLWGAAVPSATVGLELVASGGNYTSNGSICTNEQISIFCASSSKAFMCKYTL